MLRLAMSKPAYNGKDVKTRLTRKGFKEANKDHKILFLYIDGKKTSIRTKVNHGRKDYTGCLWRALKTQLRLSDADLTSFLECAMSEEAYLGNLRSEGYI
jgi:hypothetical protein